MNHIESKWLWTEYIYRGFVFVFLSDRDLNCKSTLKDCVQALIFMNYFEDTCICI